MGWKAKFNHLIGDEVVPYERSIELIESDGETSIVRLEMAATGMSKIRRVSADDVYFKLEPV